MTAKKNEVDTDLEVKEVFDAWLEQQGGKEELVSRVRGEKLTKLILGAKWEMTLAELEEKAGEAGLLEGLRGLTLAKLKEILTPESKQKKIGRPRKKPSAERQEGGGKRGRPPGKAAKIAGGKRGEATKAILKYIAEHPDCKNSDVSKGTGLDAKKTTQQLTYIRKNNWVTTKGKLRGMTYRIAAEGKKRIGG